MCSVQLQISIWFKVLHQLCQLFWSQDGISAKQADKFWFGLLSRTSVCVQTGADMVTITWSAALLLKYCSFDVRKTHPSALQRQTIFSLRCLIRANVKAVWAGRDMGAGTSAGSCCPMTSAVSNDRAGFFKMQMNTDEQRSTALWCRCWFTAFQANTSPNILWGIRKPSHSYFVFCCKNKHSAGLRNVLSACSTITLVRKQREGCSMCLNTDTKAESLRTGQLCCTWNSRDPKLRRCIAQKCCEKIMSRSL